MECTAVQIRSRFFTLENKKFRLLLLFLIMGAGAVFYFSGIQWGLPMRLHSDEDTIVDVAMQMAAAGTFEPTVFFRPDHLLIKLDTLLYQVYASLTGQSIAVLIQNTPEVFCLIARALTAAFGVACIPLAYGIGCKHKPATGLIAAALFAVFPLYVTYGHYATPDVPTVFMTLGLVYSAICYIQKPNFIWLAMMCLFVAMFVTIKYPGLVMLSVVAIAVVFVGIRTKQIKRMLLHGFAAIGIFVAATFIISPELFIHFDKAVAAFTQEARPGHLGADGLGFGGNFLFYWQEFIMSGSFVMFGFTILGCVATIKDKRADLLPVYLGFIYWTVLSTLALHWQRWGLPMFVGPLLLAAIGIQWSWQTIREKVKTKHARVAWKVVLVAAISVMTCALIVSSTARVVMHCAKDNRLAGLEFCIEQGITKENAILDAYMPLNPDDSAIMFDEFEWGDGGRLVSKEPKQYVLIGNSKYRRYRAERERYPEENAIYDAIESQGTLIASFKPDMGLTQGWSAINNIIKNIEMMQKASQGAMSGGRYWIYEWKDWK